MSSTRGGRAVGTVGEAIALRVLRCLSRPRPTTSAASPAEDAPQHRRFVFGVALPPTARVPLLKCLCCVKNENEHRAVGTTAFLCVALRPELKVEGDWSRVGM